MGNIAHPTLTWPPVRIGLGLCCVVLPVVGVETFLDGDFLIRALADCFVAWLGYLFFVQVVERRPVRELDPRAGLWELPLGLVLGAAVFAVTIGSIWGLGGVAFDGWNPAPDLRYAAGIALVAGVVEELAIRGVVFRILQVWLGSWMALGLSAATFGGIHLLNPGATLGTAAAIGLEAGVMLAAAFMVTGRLWLPIGLHIGWNFTQAGVFGVAVSGIEVGGLLQSVPIGPDWLSGGVFGAEASVLAVLWCGVAGVVLLAIASRRGRFVDAGRGSS